MYEVWVTGGERKGTQSQTAPYLYLKIGGNDRTKKKPRHLKKEKHRQCPKNVSGGNNLAFCEINNEKLGLHERHYLLYSVTKISPAFTPFSFVQRVFVLVMLCFRFRKNFANKGSLCGRGFTGLEALGLRNERVYPELVSCGEKNFPTR